MDQRLERILPRVQKPARYTGGEYRQIIKDKAEVDLRGMTTDEAELVLSQFIDRAIVGNLTQVTVIHGKGTGAVRKAVHAYLKRCKGVASFRLGRYGEGESGVTVVELR